MLPKTDTGKMLLRCVIAFIMVYYLVPYVHEFAHAATCGHDYQMIIIFTGEARSVICHDYPDNLTLYWVSGGLAGAAVAAAIAFIPKRRTWFIAAFPFVPQQLMIAGIETMATEWYNSAQGSAVSSLLATLISVCLFLVLVLSHRRKMVQSQATHGSEDKQ